MPLGPHVRYRVHRTSTGKKVRLAFKGARVIEAKNLQSGATHSPEEFAADRAKRTRGALAHRMSSLRGAGKFGASHGR